METRRLGRLEHRSSVLVYGAAALSDVSQEVADASVAEALAAGATAATLAATDRSQPLLFAVQHGIVSALAEQGIRASIGPRTRLVTHLDISRADVDKVVAAFHTFFQNWRA